MYASITTIRNISSYSAQIITVLNIKAGDIEVVEVFSLTNDLAVVLMYYYLVFGVGR